MLRKEGKSTTLPFLKRGVKLVVAAELACLAASYAGWRYLNTNQDFRFYLFKNHFWILDYYYKFGEALSPNDSVRLYDLNTWKSQNKIE